MLANAFKPGLYADYEENYYHSLPFFSSSGMKIFKKSPAHYHQWLKAERKTTLAKKIGSVTHLKTLEPKSFDSRVAVFPAPPDGSKKWDRRKPPHKRAWEAFEKDSADKYVITESENQIVNNMVIAIRKNETASSYFKAGTPEVTGLFRDPDFDFECKMRLDFLTIYGVVLDIKTTEDASEAGFMTRAYNLKNHWQAWFYLRGLEAITGIKHERFINVAVEKPEDKFQQSFVACYEVHPDALKKASEDCLPVLESYAESLQKNQFLGYPDELKWLNLPPWAWKKKG